MLALLTIANQFLVERNWWQYHNPKNETMNILVETGELAQHFITQEQITKTTQVDIGNELADVFFATLLFSVATSCNIAHSIGNLIDERTLSDVETNYKHLQETILQYRTKLGINDLTAPRQIILSLISEVSQLADLFIWCSEEQSNTIAKENRTVIHEKIARIVVHLIFFADITGLDLVTEFDRKMRINAAKYPLDTTTIEKYNALKVQHRASKKSS